MNGKWLHSMVRLVRGAVELGLESRGGERCPFCELFHEVSLAKSYLDLQKDFCEKPEGSLPKGVGGTVPLAREHLHKAFQIFLSLEASPKGAKARTDTVALFSEAIHTLSSPQVGCADVLKAASAVDNLSRIAGNLALARYGCPTCVMMRRKSAHKPG